MKVLHLLQSNRFSGAENVVCQIIGMMKNEPNIEMVYCSRDGQISEALKERGIEFYPINNLTVSEVKRVIKEYKPDIIHAHDMRASYIAARACGNITLISHVHNNNFDSRGLSVKSIAYILAAMKAKHIFWVSQSAYSGYAFHELFRKKSSILYNIIDIDELYRKMDTDKNMYDYDVIYVGRLTYPKNPQRLMRVFKAIVECLPNVKIAVVGTGDLEDEAKTLCREYRIQSNVEFLEYRNNPLKMMHDSKVMIMTSRWEGTPMCVLEAMALGVPVVSTPTDGLKDLVVNDETGYLCDEDELLADRCCNIVLDAKCHSNLSKCSLDRARVLMDKMSYKQCITGQYLKG